MNGKIARKLRKLANLMNEDNKLDVKATVSNLKKAYTLETKLKNNEVFK